MIDSNFSDIYGCKTLVEAGLVEHDPDGPDVQSHDQPDGSVVFSFSEDFAAKVPLRIGDELTWLPSKDGIGIQLVNTTYIAEQSPEHLLAVRTKVNAALDGGNES